MNRTAVARELVRVAREMVGIWSAETTWKKVESMLTELRRDDETSYNALMTEYRDSLPHTGHFDIMLGSPKFKAWVLENAADPDFAATVVDLIEDIRARLRNI